jgi:beta-glucosidase
VTFPRSIADLPPFEHYSMTGRTYRYLEKEPLYPFGYGLSYTTFEYSDIALSAACIPLGESVEVSALVTNVGSCDGDEVVQLYVKDLESSCVVPQHDLRGFARIALARGQSRRVQFRLSPRDLSLIDEHGRRILEAGRFRISIGGSQPDARSVALTGRPPLKATLELNGGRLELPY